MDESDLFKVTVVLGDGSKGGPTLNPVQATSACYHTQEVLTQVFTPGQMLKVSAGRNGEAFIESVR